MRSARLVVEGDHVTRLDRQLGWLELILAAIESHVHIVIRAASRGSRRRRRCRRAAANRVGSCRRRCSASFFSPPQAASTMASPATIEVTRIAATPPGKLPDFVNRFTSPQVYSAPHQMEEGRITLSSMGSASPQTHPSTYRVPPCRAMGPQCRGAPRHPPGRIVRGRHHLARSRGDLAPRPHRQHHLSRAMGRRGRPLRRGHAPRALPASRRVERRLALPRARYSTAIPRGRRPASGSSSSSGATASSWCIAPGTRSASCLPSPVAAGARNTDGRGRRCKSLRHRSLPDRRQYDEGGLLPRPPARDHVHAEATDARGPGAFAPLAVSLQDRPGGRSLDRGRDDLRLRLPRGRRGGLHPARPAAGRRAAGQARPVQRVAAEEPGTPPRMRF